MSVTSQLRSSDHPNVTALGSKRAAVWAVHQYRMDMAHSRMLFNETGETWDAVSREYQLTIAAAIADDPRDLYMAAKFELGQRLEVGMKALQETPEVAALFSRLLWRYEASCDVLVGIKSVSEWIDRLNHRAGMELQWKQGYGKREKG